MCNTLPWTFDATGILDTQPARGNGRFYREYIIIALSLLCVRPPVLASVCLLSHSCLIRTLVELARLPPVPSAPPTQNRAFIVYKGHHMPLRLASAVLCHARGTHQWPYSTYLGDTKGLLSNSTPGVPGVAYGGDCSTLAGIQENGSRG